MRRFILMLPAAAILALAAASPLHSGPPKYAPHLVTLGFDTLGPPSSGLNSEIVKHPTEPIVYVGSLNFDIDEFGTDSAFKTVDVSDPTNPEVIDSDTPIGNLGPFDVKVAGDVLAASVQGTPDSHPGVTVYDVSDPANPLFASHLDDVELSSPTGSHNSFLWQDGLNGRVWLFATGLDLTSLKIYDVTNPHVPVFAAEYNNGHAQPFIHDNFVQETRDGRVLEYQASGTLGMEILDVTKVVRGGFVGPLTFAADVVAYNHYGANPAHAALVTRPNFSHYIEPTASGNVTWVGDETECGPNSIIHAFGTSALPRPPAKVVLREIGTIIANPDPPNLCPALVHANSDSAAAHAQHQPYRWTGHNFDISGDGLMIRGDYGRGVTVWDISNPAAAKLVAKSRGLNQGVGDENRAEPGRDSFFENYPWVWQAVYDGDLIYASDINQGLYVLDLVGD
jgi:hypothetical protein